MLDAVKRQLASEGTAATIEFLRRQSDRDAVMSAFHDLLMHAYWDRKDVAAVVPLAHAGIAYCLACARQHEEMSPEAAGSATRAAQVISYNLASFCWVGWGEPGIVLGPAERKVGLEAARTSLNLVECLKLEDMARARGEWMMGVHLLAAGCYTEARGLFGASEAHAAAAHSRGETLLARAFAQLAAVLEQPGDPDAQQALDYTRRELAGVEDGAEFVTQIDTAQRLCKPLAVGG